MANTVTFRFDDSLDYQVQAVNLTAELFPGISRKDSLSDPSIGIYFVVESKWGKADANLQEVEHNKIKCGKLHFAAVSEQVKFDWIKSYDDFKQKFGVAEGVD